MNQQQKNVDVAIIGAGTAGMSAYYQVSKQTDSVALIEGGEFGTTCARVGCMPSKLLIAAAEAANYGLHTSPFGVHYAPPEIDGKAVMKRVRDERDRFVDLVLETVDGFKEEHKIRARAKFLDDHRLELSNGTVLEAGRIIIATGSQANIPAEYEHLGKRLIINDDVFEWLDLPESAAVVGTGVIGLELGQALARLGVRTTLIGRDHQVGPLTDPDVLESANRIITDEMDFIGDGQITSAAVEGNGVRIEYTDGEASHRQHYEYVLMATGRRPDIAGLGLENTSLELDMRGMPVFNLDTAQCGGSHIFIAGDVNAKFPLLHEAADEGRIAGYNAAHFPSVKTAIKSTPITVVFSDPQIMMVGQSHRDLTQNGMGFASASLDWSDQGRSRVMLINKGLIKLYGDPGTGHLLGAEMFGPRAEHLAHLLAWSIQSSLTVEQMLERPFYHPVVEEGIRSALRLLLKEMGLGPKPLPRCIDCGPGG